MVKIIFLLSLFALSCNSIEQKSTEQENNTEQKSAKLEVNADEVKIGNQVWMTKNLNVDKFRNGDPIPEAKSDEEWERAWEKKQPAWCYIDNATRHGAKYGRLYNWYAVIDSRGLAPKGWRVPSDAEWTQLTDHLGGESIAGYQMRSSTGWKSLPNRDASNSGGFLGLPGGSRSPDGPFSQTGYSVSWWSSTDYNAVDAWSRFLSSGNGSAVVKYASYKGTGAYVRCIRE